MVGVNTPSINQQTTLMFARGIGLAGWVSTGEARTSNAVLVSYAVP